MVVCEVDTDQRWNQERKEEEVPAPGYSVHQPIDTIPGDATSSHDLLGDVHVDGLQRRQSIALYLDRAPVLPLPSDRAHVLLEHQHVEPFPLRRQRKHQPPDPAAGYQNPQLPRRNRRLRRGNGNGSATCGRHHAGAPLPGLATAAAASGS